MSTVVDYVGRTVDLLAFQSSGTGASRRLEQALVDGATSSVIAGIQKLSQRFLMTLLTDRGSMLYLPLLGTRFLTDARAGQWRTAADVRQSFYSALLDVRRQLVPAETDADPNDERFANAVLTSVSLVAGGATLGIRLSSRAGTARTIITPIPIVIR